MSVSHRSAQCWVSQAIDAYLAPWSARAGSVGGDSLGADLGHAMVGTQGRQGRLLGCNYRFCMLKTTFQSLNLSGLFLKIQMCFNSET